MSLLPLFEYNFQSFGKIWQCNFINEVLLDLFYVDLSPLIIKFHLKIIVYSQEIWY